MTDQELEALLRDLESDRTERKASLADKDRICEAICAFANDLPAHREPGVLFIGINNNGTCANLPITDALLLEIADIRTSGNILPLPDMLVQKRVLNNCEIAVVIVQPADAPPVRFRGRTYIRVGPRRAIATPQEERRLAEKRRAGDLPFDIQPVLLSDLNDLDLDLFKTSFLPASIAYDILAENQRTTQEQLLSLRLLTPKFNCNPSVLGVLTIGKDPRQFLPGAYIQFLRIDGTELTDPIKDQKEIDGPLIQMLRQIDELLQINISTATDVTSQQVETRQPDYPLEALRQVTRNAVLHRNYDFTNSPIRISWFIDRIEVLSPGGPFGQVNIDNFGEPGITDYRNPHLAEAMKNLGFVQRFGLGISITKNSLRKNGNPPPIFQATADHILVTIQSR
jgi:ATP-dependent DNA helicase RecG